MSDNGWTPEGIAVTSLMAVLGLLLVIMHFGTGMPPIIWWLAVAALAAVPILVRVLRAGGAGARKER